jgi:ABC-type branched-subunit amino acid transport system ATPase component
MPILYIVFSHHADVEENLRIGLAVRRPRIHEVPEHLYQMFPVHQADAAPARR